MGDWTISSRTFALPVGGGAVHAYIAIKDGNGRVAAEYHGFPIDRATGDNQGGNPISFTPFHDFRLQAEGLSGEFWDSTQDLRVHDEEVFRGSQSQVRQIQSALDAARHDINPKDLDYGILHLVSESQNSNSVYGMLMGVARGPAV